MAADDNTEGQSQKKRAMPDFVKDALKTGTTRPQKPASPKRVIVNPLLTDSAPFLLPFSSDTSRLVPDAVLRSALFCVMKRGERPFYKKPKEIASLENLKVFYAGEQLDQGDLDVWETVLHIHSTKKEELGTEIRMTGYELLKLMGLTDSGKNRKILVDRLFRLTQSTVTIDTPKYRYDGGLLIGVLREKETEHFLISLNPRIAVLFASTRFSQIDWVIRQSLKGQQLAQWLHGFYATHAKPLPMKIETLHRLCGSTAAKLYHFKQELIKALNIVSEVSTNNNQPFSYEIIGDLVHVFKTASKTQQKHLASRTRKTTTTPAKLSPE